ncbi:MAG: sulfite exporter TauE/SafE family protein [bacterium]
MRMEVNDVKEYEGPRAIMRTIRFVILSTVFALAAVCVSAHPLSQFSVNHFNTVEFTPETVRVHTLIDIAEIPAFGELGRMDTDNDAQLTQEEIDAYLLRRTPEILSSLFLSIDGTEVSFRTDHSAARFYPGLARITCTQILAQFSADIDLPGQPVQVTFREKSFPENTKDFGQLRVRFLGGLKIPMESIQIAAGRTVEPVPETVDTWLLPSGDVTFSLVPGAVEAETGSTVGFPYVDTLVSPTIIPPQPLQFNADGAIAIFRSDKSQKVPNEGVTKLQPRALQSFPALPKSGAPSSTTGKSSAESAMQERDRKFGELVSREELSPLFILFALVLAAFYGAGHALTPGHGKTIVAAYLVGSRGTVWHAFYLGLIVTLTHMGSVFIIGFITLQLQSSFVEGGNLVPVMEGISGLLVAGIGFYLFLSRYRELVRAKTLTSVGVQYDPFHHQPHAPSHSHDHDHDHNSGHSHSHDDDHDHHDEHAHSHHDDHADHHEHSHSHGGDHHQDHSHHGHSHEIPEGASLWDLFVLGISGGMVPCPTAIIVLLVAVNIGRTAFGLLLIAAFSAGLATVLIVVGILMVTAKHFLDRFSFSGSMIRILPVFSGILITFIGFWLTVYALVRGGIIVVNI